MNHQPASRGLAPEEAGFSIDFLALVLTACPAAVIFLPVCDIYHLRLSPRSW
jgi:hypothetical protein